MESTSSNLGHVPPAFFGPSRMRPSSKYIVFVHGVSPTSTGISLFLMLAYYGLLLNFEVYDDVTNPPYRVICVRYWFLKEASQAVQELDGKVVDGRTLRLYLVMPQ